VAAEGAVMEALAEEEEVAEVRLHECHFLLNRWAKH
tara:strand:+ start:119 stop:226 length:108 start_codon:yes stop_codon:yes gene_type:complete